MPAPEKVTDSQVAEKLESGAELSATERKHAMSLPKDSDTNAPVAEETDDSDAETVDENESTGIAKDDESDDTGTTDAPEKKAAVKTEASPSEKPGDKTAAKSPESDEVSAESRKKIEAELEKPEGHEDLTGYTPREVGLFFDMKKQRLRAQRAEEENETLKFERMQNDLKAKEAAGKKPDAEVVEDEDPLKDRDDSDLLTVADVKKLLKGNKPAKTEEPAKAVDPMLTQLYIQNQKLEARMTLKEKGVNDLDDVLAYAEDVLGKDADATAYLTKVAEKKGNIVLATYNLIRGSSRWSQVEAAIKKSRGELPAENVKRAEKIEENEKKTKTTGPGGSAAVPGEYTVGEIAKMSTVEFAALPKAKRKAIMEKYGSNPNRSV